MHITNYGSWAGSWQQSSAGMTSTGSWQQSSAGMTSTGSWQQSSAGMTSTGSWQQSSAGMTSRTDEFRQNLLFLDIKSSIALQYSSIILKTKHACAIHQYIFLPDNKCQINHQSV
jgi:hypothetical protein